MNYIYRQDFYRKIEEKRKSKVLALVTSDRHGEYWQGKGVATIIADDCVSHLVALLDKIGPTGKISLILHTNGGQTLVAWRLINLIRTFADDFEVIIPQKALSAGTMIAIGANRIVMSKQAVLGPIDPSVNNVLNPVIGNNRVPISVENLRAYLNGAKDQLNIKNKRQLANIFGNLSTHLHPIVIGEAFRARDQIRFLASKLLKIQLPEDRSQIGQLFRVPSTNQKRTLAIIDFLCADSGSHDYTINRREARLLGLKIENPDQTFYKDLWDIYLSYANELKLTSQFSAENILGQNTQATFSDCRGLVESTEGGSIAFTTEATLLRQQPSGYNASIQFEGWKKTH